MRVPKWLLNQIIFNKIGHYIYISKSAKTVDVVYVIPMTHLAISLRWFKCFGKTNDNKDT